MDLKALIAKMDQIESKRFLTEDEDRQPAKKKETSWTDKSGKKHPATQVQGHQSRKADKEAEKESKRKDEGIVFRSGIAQELLREFNLAEQEFTFSPEQEKWLGGSDRQDPYILARMPGPKPPASFFTDPESQAIIKNGGFSKIFKGPVGAPGTARPGAPVQSGSGAPVQSGTGGVVRSATPAPDTTSGRAPERAVNNQSSGYTAQSQAQKTAPAGGQAASPAAAPAGVQAQVDDAGNTTITTPDGKMKVVGPDGNVIPPGGGKQPTATASAPGGGQAASPAAAADPNAGYDEFGGLDAAIAAQAAQQADTTSPDTSGTGAGTKPAAPATSYDSFGNPVAAGSAAATNADPTGLAQTQLDVNKDQAAQAASPAKPAGGQAASPAKPAGGGAAWMKKLSPTVFAQASQLGLIQNGQPVDAAIKKFQTDNGLQSDGIIGPQTTIAIQSASGKGGQAASPAKPAGGQAASPAKPAGGQAASPAKPAGGQAASPAPAGGQAPRTGPNGEPAVRNPRTGQMGYMKRTGRSQTFVPFPEGGQGASPSSLPGRAVPGGGQISDTPASESVDYSDINRLLTLALWR